MIGLKEFVKVLVFVSCLVYEIHSVRLTPRLNEEGCDFTCRNGDCLNDLYVCDGIANCRDGSDETEAQCGNISCPSYLFRCDYGPCIDKSKMCNNEADCADNSDEKAANCENEKREGKCTEFEYQCHDYECIDQIVVCDGIANCNDSSDETAALCAGVICQEYLYRCAYGACVPKEARCNGSKDCADGSDETNCHDIAMRPIFDNNAFDCVMPEQPKHGTYHLNLLDEDKSGDFDKGGSKLMLICDKGYTWFGTNYFYCLYSVWIPYPSDDLCKRRCPPIPWSSTYEVSCKYNGNQTIDCREAVEGTSVEAICAASYRHDVSDNSNVAVCQADGSWSQPLKPCILVNVSDSCELVSLENGKYKDVGENTYVDFNVFVRSRMVVEMVCDPGYIPIQTTLFYCFEGKWNPPLGRGSCLRTCRSLYPTDSYTVTCQLNGQNDNCTSPVEKTIARVSCQPYFKEVNHPIPLCQNGEWDPPPVPCQPVCGRKIVNVQTLVIGGNHTIPGEYPWIVAIYRPKRDAYEQICSGSLISRFFVLSAAHCFADSSGIAFDKSIFTLVAGKYHRDFYKNESGSQIRKISELYFPGDFRGAIQAYRDDIALIKVDEKFELSQTVQLVCVDWNNFYEDHDFRDKNPGVVAGWGHTQEGSTPAETLMKLVVPYRSMSLCKRHLDMNFYNRFLFSDKFCAGYISKGMNVCKGDSGGGLFFQSQTDTYFIRGIVSLTAPSTGGCNSNQYALYTKVSKYLQWLKDRTLLNI